MNWEEHARMDTDIAGHLSTLYEYASKCKTVTEWGVRRGESTLALLEGVKQNDGHVYSVDVAPCYRARLRMVRLGLSKWWTFVQGDDLEVEARPSEMVFIDTDHYLEHTMKEIHRAVSLKPRYIFLHDVNAPLWPDMKKAVELA